MLDNKKTRLSLCLGTCGVVIGVLATSGAAYGATSMSPASAAGPQRLASASVLKHYSVVESEDFIIPISGQSEGSVACPTGTVPLGGGGDMAPSLGLSLSTSRPDSTDWDVIANNNTNALQFFRVFAVCAQAPKGYAVSVHAVNNPAGTVTSSLAPCPTGTVVLGGGFSSFSSSSLVSANASWPTAKVAGQPNGWQVLVANASSGDNLAADAVAVCGKKPDGYHVATGSATLVQANSDARATATCPGRTVPTGGGLMTGANPPQLLEVLNSTLPVTKQWQSFENDGGGLADLMTAVTVCARR